MPLDDFYLIYPLAAQLYMESGLEMDVVEREYGEREDWGQIRGLLLGSDGIPPNSVPGQSSNWFHTIDGHEYWPSHLQLLSQKKGWSKRELQSIDIASSKIVNHLFNPTENGAQTRHGLVIGHVQSGKTANYTAVLAKAADSGYNFFIVLTGLYNDLRDQTQARISKELVGSLEDPDGIHLDSNHYSVKWKEETMLGRDFHNLEHPIDGPDPTIPTICVMKKNVSPLEKVIEWIETFDQSTLEQLNVLIIDDEADHASVNMMDREEYDYRGEPQRSPSTINLLMRTLVNIIPRVSYVGYTATPFANVFINPEEEHDEYGMTLYPRDFIVSLPKPANHFGLEDVFPSEPNAEWPNVVIVPEDDAEILREMTDVERVSIDVPESMWVAIIDYLITSGIRRVRGDLTAHHTMMIHTRHTIENMTPLVRRIRNIIAHFEVNLLNSRSTLGQHELRRFEQRFIDEFQSKGCPEEWIDVQRQIKLLLNRDCPEVFEINMDSEDVLDFDSNQQRGLKAIAVGGNRLSRGLTLEGLCVSFFIRPTTTHDTLMQMSRWFGFRRGFSDLIRVHVTAEISERFAGMVEVERELRDDLERYEQQDELTPLDFGVRVLQQQGMDPTRPGARRNIRTLRTGISAGQKIHFTESFNFQNPELLKENLSEFASLISQLHTPEPIGNNDKSFIWRGVNPEPVINFFESINYPEQPQWPIEHILHHIQNRVSNTPDELSSWSIALIGLQSGTRTSPLSEYGVDLNLVMPRRTRKIGSNGLGWIAGSIDTVVDLGLPLSHFNGHNGKFSYNRMWSRRDPSNPLLLVYIIDKDSEAGGHRGRQVTSSRTNLFRDGEEPVHVLGLALVLPRAVLNEEEMAQMRDYWIRENAEPFPGL